MNLLETQLTLLKRIEDLEEARSQLQDGEPCPLCGAREHPFAEGNIPVPDETQRRLAGARGELKSVSTGITDLKVRLAQVQKDLEQTLSDQKKHAESIANAGLLIAENCAAIPSEPKLSSSDPGLFGRLEEIREENARQMGHTAGILQAADAMEKELAALRDSLEKSRQSFAEREREVLTAAHQKDTAGQLQERLRTEAAQCHELLEKSLAALQQEIAPYGIAELGIDTLDAVIGQLTVRRDQWLARSRQRTALEMQIQHQAEQIDKTRNDIGKQQQLAGLVRDREALQRERQELFADGNADAEEVRLSSAIAAAEHELDSARQQLSAANQELAQLTARMEELQKAISARDLQLRTANASFQTRLKATGFSDEENYRSARLPENERRRLALQAQKLSDEKTGIATQVREKNRLLDTERQKKITEAPLEELTDRYLLVHDDSQPLELNVIDNYQAGEIRSTKNLSGGEGFIVSLSLALGLSQMASRNVRVDSLFLDEGFGTLDEESLDTALETLASLQQEGKLIGVISHVPALKERISTRIQVIPQTGGRRRISGPGCA